MKKFLFLLLLSISCILFAACGNKNFSEDSTSSKNMVELPSEIDMDEDMDVILESESSEADLGMENMTQNKILVVYFSWAENAEPIDVDAVTSASVTAPGDVARLASWVAEEADADIFSIRVTEPYPADWDCCLERANQEKADNARPQLIENVVNIEEYDRIFLGFPNWWYSCPMAVLSFTQTHDLADKQIYLFCSHGTGGLARSVQDITASLPDSCHVSENVFDVYQEDVADSQESIKEWVKAVMPEIQEQ